MILRVVVQIGITRGDKRNQRSFAAFFQLSEYFFNTAHGSYEFKFNSSKHFKRV